jgi:hypothetical protein
MLPVRYSGQRSKPLQLKGNRLLEVDKKCISRKLSNALKHGKTKVVNYD